MANLTYEQACERKAFIIRCLDVLTNIDDSKDIITDMMRFLSGEYKIADARVKAELLPILQKSNNKIQVLT